MAESDEDDFITSSTSDWKPRVTSTQHHEGKSHVQTIGKTVPSSKFRSSSSNQTQRVDKSPANESTADISPISRIIHGLDITSPGNDDQEMAINIEAGLKQDPSYKSAKKRLEENLKRLSVTPKKESLSPMKKTPLKTPSPVSLLLTPETTSDLPPQTSAQKSGSKVFKFKRPKMCKLSTSFDYVSPTKKNVEQSDYGVEKTNSLVKSVEVMKEPNIDQPISPPISRKNLFNDNDDFILPSPTKIAPVKPQVNQNIPNSKAVHTVQKMTPKLQAKVSPQPSTSSCNYQSLQLIQTHQKSDAVEDSMTLTNVVDTIWNHEAYRNKPESLSNRAIQQTNLKFCEKAKMTLLEKTFEILEKLPLEVLSKLRNVDGFDLPMWFRIKNEVHQLNENIKSYNQLLQRAVPQQNHLNVSTRANDSLVIDNIFVPTTAEHLYVPETELNPDHRQQLPNFATPSLPAAKRTLALDTQFNSNSSSFVPADYHQQKPIFVPETQYNPKPVVVPETQAYKNFVESQKTSLLDDEDDDDHILQIMKDLEEEKRIDQGRGSHYNDVTMKTIDLSTPNSIPRKPYAPRVNMIQDTIPVRFEHIPDTELDEDGWQRYSVESFSQDYEESGFKSANEVLTKQTKKKQSLHDEIPEPVSGSSIQYSTSTVQFHSGVRNDGIFGEFEGFNYPHSDQLKLAFRDVFGLKHFRPNQLQIINASMVSPINYVNKQMGSSTRGRACMRRVSLMGESEVKGFL